ncbi:MAG: NACHT domain-containing protein [Desertifilum sp.]|nr:NACHT domain-containing protein [Desertifilum sp.]
MTANSPAKTKRHRGYILTPVGAKKLKHRISELEATTGVKYNPPKIAEQSQLMSAQGLHPTTVRKIFRGSGGSDRSSLALIFQVLGLEMEESDYTQPGFTEAISINARQDWGEAVDVSLFYGRQPELTTLQQWIVGDRCRLVALLGIGGVGKTALSVKLAQNLQDQFEFTFWRSLRHAPSLDTLLRQLLQFFGQLPPTSALTSLTSEPIGANGIAQLMEILRRSRCLIVLDNLESLLQPGRPAGQYREGYIEYSELLRQIAETPHQSCLVLTSREKPQEIAVYEGETSSTRSFLLGGLTPPESDRIFQAKGLRGSPDQIQQLNQRYQGNPLALKIAATSIHQLFSGNIAEFLEQGIIIFNGIRNLLNVQFDRLSSLEQQILYWLAINREPVTLNQLRDDLVPLISPSRLLELIEYIGWRSLIEIQTPNAHLQQFTLQPVVMEYACDRLIEEASEEIIQYHQTAKGLDSFDRLRYLALLKAQSQDYIRQSQIQFILDPIAQKLAAAFGNAEHPIAALKSILQLKAPLNPPGYLASNLLNLLVHLQADLSHLDLSGLTLAQANLQGVNLRSANLSHCHLAKTVFSETFSPIYSIALSPDGTQLATGHGDGEIRLWEVNNGQLLFKNTAHTHTIWSLVYSPDSSSLVSSSFDGTLGIWDASTGSVKHMVMAHADWIWAVAASPDGQWIATGSNDRTIKLWSWDLVCQQTWEGHAAGVSCLSFSPDSATLASGSSDRTIRLWDRDRCRILYGHREPVCNLSFSPDGETLASCETERILLWDVETGEFYQDLSETVGFVWSVLFAPSPSAEVIYGDRASLQLWDSDLETQQQILTGFNSQIWAIATDAGAQLLAASDKQTLKLWKRAPDSRYQLWQTLASYHREIRAVSWHADGPIAGSSDGSLSLWNAQTRTCTHLLSGHQGAIRSLASSPHHQWIASTGEDRTIRLWDANSGKARLPLLGHSSRVWSVSFSPDGLLLASGSSDRTLRVWEVNSGRCLRILSGHQSWVLCVAFSPNGQLLASSSADRTLRLWCAATGELLKTWPVDGELVSSVAFTPDSRWLASAGEDGTLKIWDVLTAECLRTLSAHQGLVWSVAFSPLSCPNGLLLASGGVDQAIKLWNPTTGVCLQVLNGHTSAIWSLAFSPDGQSLLSGSKDETLKLWDLHDFSCLETLCPERLYENMQITGVTGLTDAQRDTLKALGAIESSVYSF